MELMKQRQYTPMSVGMMAISLFAVERDIWMMLKKIVLMHLNQPCKIYWVELRRGTKHD